MKYNITGTHCFIIKYLLLITYIKSSSTNTNYDMMFVLEAKVLNLWNPNYFESEFIYIIEGLKLIKIIENVSILIYYDDIETYVEWSDWKTLQNSDKLTSFLNVISTKCVGKYSGNIRTALEEMCNKVKNKTICMLYSITPPHRLLNIEIPRENVLHQKFNSEWQNLCQIVKNKKIRVYSFIGTQPSYIKPYFIYLSKFTLGESFTGCESRIYDSTIGIIFNISGVEYKHNWNVKILSFSKNFDYQTYCITDTAMPAIDIMHVNIKPINELINNIKQLEVLFKVSKEYRGTVYRYFDFFFTVEKIMFLPKSPLITMLWHFVTNQTDNTQNILKLKLKNILTSDHIDSNVSRSLDVFFTRSFPEETIFKNLSTTKTTQFYIYECDSNIEKHRFLRIGKFCDTNEIITIMEIIKNIRISKIEPDYKSNRHYISANIESNKKFLCLSHLLYPKTMFTVRKAAIIAAVAITYVTFLKNDAIEFLDEIRGQWINFSLSENITLEFSLLMMSVAEYALTDDEISQLHIINKVSILRLIKSCKISVEVAYSSRNTLRPDIKEQCRNCHQWRSITSIIATKCRFCIYNKNSEIIIDQNKIQSIMSECSMCLIHYENYEDLKYEIDPLCYYCKNGILEKSYVDCIMCKNKFYCQQRQMALFKCAVCLQNKIRIGQRHLVTVEDYIKQNGTSFIGFKIKNIGNIFNNGFPLVKIDYKERLKAEITDNKSEEDNLLTQVLQIGKGAKKEKCLKEVWNSQEIKVNILKKFILPRTNFMKNRCALCSIVSSETELKGICGNFSKDCLALSCVYCLKEWYNQLKLGQICNPKYLVCPICKEYPVEDVVAKYNPILCKLVKTIDILEFDPSYVYAWCIKCHKIKNVARYDIWQDNNITFKNYKCDDCIE